jgi:hypothetical protein
MSTFLIANNNLNDLTDIPKARLHLGIGSLAIQDSNNVHIDGGNITVDKCSLHTNDARVSNVLVAIDEDGTMGWREPITHNWTLDPQDTINISEFVNDMNYVRTDDLSDVAFSGNYEDLANKPNSVTHFYEDSAYFRVDKNLAEVVDKEKARQNLGLGPLAVQDTYYVTVSNLFVKSEFRFFPEPSLGTFEGKYLSLGEDNKATWINLPIASDDTYGLIQLKDSFMSSSTQHAPTAYALRNAYYDLYYRVADVNEQLFINTLIDYFGLLTKKNNLHELHEKRDKVRTNLEIGSIASQDVDDVNVGHLQVKDALYYKNAPIVGGVLKCGHNGVAYWQQMPIAVAPQYAYQEGNYGLVKISNHYMGNTDDVVPSAYAISNMFHDLSSYIEDVKELIPTRLSQLNGMEQYIFAEDNLFYVNANVARYNLGLHTVAHTGDYNNLINAPTHLSYFNNDKFLERNNNLSDLTNTLEARKNLDLGNMCLQNKDSVHITNGTARFNELSISDRFTFDDNGATDLLGKFLRAENDLGEVHWCDLPVATEEIYGTVQLSHDLQEVNTGKVASAATVYRVYHTLLARIEQLDNMLIRYQFFNNL